MAKKVKKVTIKKVAATQKKTLKGTASFGRKKGGDASSGTSSTGPRKTE